MDKKKIAAAAIVAITIVIAYTIFTRKGSEGIDSGNIISNEQKISANDVHIYMKRIRFDNDKISSIFSSGVVTQFTVKFFKFLHREFKNMNFEEHLRTIEEYLTTTMDSAKAAQMFELYKKFILYEKNMSRIAKKWAIPKSPAEALNYLRNIQDYRRDFFGKQIADTMFGIHVKHMEYHVRKQAVIGDKRLYGADKEKRLKDIREKMWTDDANNIDSNMRPFDQYQERLSIYDRDLNELSKENRTVKIKEYRKQFFSPDTVERLEKVDELLDMEKRTETDYRQKEQQIISDPNLNTEEKKQKILEIQDGMFGDNAAAFRRRENIRRATDKFKSR